MLPTPRPTDCTHRKVVPVSELKCTPIAPSPQDEVRFWSKVDYWGGDADDCWLWTASCFARGYGQFCMGTSRLKAHRVAWVIACGRDVPAGMIVCHACNNPPCVNPLHLRLCTHKDNADDREASGKTARGDRNGQRIHPERTARGRAHSERMREVAVRGERHPHAKISDAQCAELRALHASGGWSYCALGRWAGISRVQARNIVQGKSRVPRK